MAVDSNLKSNQHLSFYNSILQQLDVSAQRGSSITCKMLTSAHSLNKDKDKGGEQGQSECDQW